MVVSLPQHMRTNQINESLTAIVVPNSVTYIEQGVFESCSNLISVTLSNNLTNIPTNLFENAFSLTTIYYSGTAKVRHGAQPMQPSRQITLYNPKSSKKWSYS